MFSLLARGPRTEVVASDLMRLGVRAPRVRPSDRFPNPPPRGTLSSGSRYGFVSRPRARGQLAWLGNLLHRRVLLWSTTPLAARIDSPRTPPRRRQRHRGCVAGTDIPHRYRFDQVPTAHASASSPNDAARCRSSCGSSPYRAAELPHRADPAPPISLRRLINRFNTLRPFLFHALRPPSAVTHRPAQYAAARPRRRVLSSAASWSARVRPAR